MSYDSEAQTFPPLSSRAIDWMGYHNGNTSQNSSDDLFCPSLVTVKNHLNRNWMLTLRQGNLAAARMGMLISISYPTGGRSDFEYELNDYSRDTAYERTIPGVSAPGYGIRISRIINRDADGRAVGIRNFSYIGLDGRSSGRQLWRPALYVGYSAKTNILNSITHETLSTADAFPYSRGVFIEYDRVLETVSGGQSFAGASITERRYDSYSSLGCRDVTSAWSTRPALPPVPTLICIFSLVAAVALFGNASIQMIPTTPYVPPNTHIILTPSNQTTRLVQTCSLPISLHIPYPFRTPG